MVRMLIIKPCPKALNKKSAVSVPDFGTGTAGGAGDRT